jgi:hypothetical protein
MLCSISSINSAIGPSSAYAQRPCLPLDLLASRARCLLSSRLSRFGLPREIVGDRDTRLTAKYTGILRALKVKVKLKMSPRESPQVHGSTSCFNRTFVQMVRVVLINCDHRDGELLVPGILFHTTTWCILLQSLCLMCCCLVGHLATYVLRLPRSDLKLTSMNMSSVGCPNAVSSLACPVFALSHV